MFNPAWSNTQAFLRAKAATPAPPTGSDPSQFAGNDWTDAQFAVDTALFDAGLPTRFTQPQYGALSAWSTVGNSNYNGLTVSVRQRLSSLTMDFNYTFSHSLDDVPDCNRKPKALTATTTETALLSSILFADAATTRAPTLIFVT